MRDTLQMADEEAPQQVFKPKKKNSLRLTLTEQLLIGTMLLTLAVALMDSIDGNKIGKNNNLETAKLQGQQELMAAKLK